MNKGYMYAKDNRLYINDTEILLRGVGLGGWMLPEGYMWGSYKKITRPRLFEQRIIELIGETDANLFWEKYYKTYISDDDFKLISDKGFNSIRLPVNFRMIMEENEQTKDVVFKEYGFEMIDYTIKQCKKNNLYVVLDLHGAPGGQTGANIDDSKYDKPELFTKSIYESQLITLWEEIARRYKDETQVVMYDLLNEPLPKSNKHLYDRLIPMYKKVMKAIRKIDKHHMFSLEGVHWATDVSVFQTRMDDNIVLHFHKYWNSPELEAMKPFLDKREELSYPLYMGEGGENELYWYSASFKMYEQLDISWNFWAYKKINNYNSVISFKMDEGWLALFEDEVTVDKANAKALLDQFLENIAFENCTVNDDVINHLFRKDQCRQLAPFYDYFGPGESFHTNNSDEGKIRKKDHVKIVNKDYGKWNYHFSKYDEAHRENDQYPYLEVKDGEWYNYTFYKTTSKRQVIEIFSQDLQFDVLINGEKLTMTKGAHSMIVALEDVIGKFVVTIVCQSKGMLKWINLK